MKIKTQIPEHLAAYLAVKKPLDVKAIAALKKWAFVGLPGVELLPEKHDCCCCCCCCCKEGAHGEQGTITLTESTMLWAVPGSYPQREIADIYSRLTWNAPQGATVTIEVEHLRANGTPLRSYVIFDNLPSSGFRIWDPPLDIGGGYGNTVCFHARTDTGLSRTVCRSAG